jgi:hypothetical protein
VPAPSGGRGGLLLDTNRTVTGRSSRPVGVVDGPRHIVRRYLCREIDRARVRSEVEALGAVREQAIEGRRQHVLAGVLLHVLETPNPVHRSGHDGPRLQRAIGEVHHAAVILVDHLQHPSVAERAGVEWLAAGCRVERRGGQLHRIRRGGARG